jgi:hypothetical protein
MNKGAILMLASILGAMGIVGGIEQETIKTIHDVAKMFGAFAVCAAMGLIGMSMLTEEYENDVHSSKDGRTMGPGSKVRT